MEHESFSNVLRSLRTENKISQEKLAELCELDRTYISLLERGLRQPTLSTVFRIAKSLGVSASELIKKVEDHYETN
jgi:transcriptional regulator with XRE-family HTH domain